VTAPEVPQQQTWRPVPGYEASYEVSDHGAVRSLSRRVTLADGRTNFIAGRYLNIAVLPKGYHQVALYANGIRKFHKVHRLVLEAFVGSGEGLQARHLNGVPCDNRLVNLAWGTASENIQDQVDHGTHWAARATHCPQHHPYSGDNLILIEKTGQRQCRECGRAASREYQRRKRANSQGGVA
jgi:hypothetical protein